MIDPDEISIHDLKAAIVAPAMTFQGKPLWKWSRVASWLYVRMSLLDSRKLENWLLMVWLLRQRGGADAEADLSTIIPRCLKTPDETWSEIILWMNDLSPQDEEEAMQIHDSILGIAQASEIEVAPEPGQKKTGETPPMTGAICSTSSENADGIEEPSYSIRPL